MFVYRSDYPAWMTSILEELRIQVPIFVAETVSTDPKKNLRGSHYACILGNDRQNKTVSNPSNFFKTVLLKCSTGTGCQQMARNPRKRFQEILQQLQSHSTTVVSATPEAYVRSANSWLTP